MGKTLSDGGNTAKIHTKFSPTKVSDYMKNHVRNCLQCCIVQNVSLQHSSRATEITMGFPPKRAPPLRRPHPPCGTDQWGESLGGRRGNQCSPRGRRGEGGGRGMGRRRSRRRVKRPESRERNKMLRVHRKVIATQMLLAI